MSNFSVISKVNAQFNDLKNVIDNAEGRVGSGSLGSRLTSIEPLLGMVANLAIGLGFATGFVGATYGMIMLIMSKGEKQEITKARDAFIWSIAAIIISYLAVILKDIFFEGIGVESSYL